MAEWRDQSFQGKIQELLDTMASEPGFHAITARLSPEIEAKSLAAPTTITFLQQRIMYQLRDLHREGELSGIPDLVLILEQIQGRATHLHGAFSFDHSDPLLYDPTEVEIIRKAFRLGCGEWAHARQHQVKTEADPDFMWASYVLKDAVKMVPFIRDLNDSSSMLTTFNGRPWSATQGILRRTKTRYAAERASWCRATPAS